MTERKIPKDASVAIGFALLLTTIATLVGDMTVGAIVTPFVFVFGAYAMMRMTIRDSMLRLMFLALALQDPNDGSPVKGWAPPFAGAGAALLDHLKAAGRDLGWVEWGFFSVMDLFLVTLLVLSYARRALKSKLDSADRIPTPRPLVRLVAVSLIGTGFTWLLGIALGGDVSKSLWQLNRVMYLPLVVYLFHIGLRGPQDLGALFKVVVSAAVYKSLLAMYVVATHPYSPDPETGTGRPIYATGHQDSVLFATAFATVLVLVIERVGGWKVALRRAALLVPIIGMGIWANNRRTAWVQVAAVFLTIYLLSATNPIKRAIQRALLFIVPTLAVYVMVGWERGSTLFAPVKLLRSVVDAKSDGSSYWREMENYDLMQTLKANPIFGTGYGHKYYEIVKLPEVNYNLEFYCPHNSLLGIWAYAGVVGWTTLSLLWICGVYFAVRSYRASREPEVRAGALAIVGAMVVYIIQSWADLGIGSWIAVFIIGAAFPMAGKLAVHTKEW